MNRAEFHVADSCIGCGKCVLVCPGGVLSLGEDHKPRIKDFSEFGWIGHGCWRCKHCLAVCPQGAIRILGHKPEDSLPPVSPDSAAPFMDALIAGRHSHRRYLDRNVEKNIIDDMVARLGNAPNGSNKQQVEFTLIDDKEQMKIFRSAAYNRMTELAEQGVYPEGFEGIYYEDMKNWEKTVRPDMLLCGVPHALIPHAPIGSGEYRADVLVAGTYFELLCASRGLCSVMLTFPLNALKQMPEIKSMLEIPEDHYIGMIIGFGYPEIEYARGTQRQIPPERIHRLTFK